MLQWRCRLAVSSTAWRQWQEKPGRSPSVECHVAGTIKAAVDAERSLCLDGGTVFTISNTVIDRQPVCVCVCVCVRRSGRMLIGCSVVCWHLSNKLYTTPDHCLHSFLSSMLKPALVHTVLSSPISLPASCHFSRLVRYLYVSLKSFSVCLF